MPRRARRGAELPRLPPGPASARLAGLRDRVDLRERHQRSGLLRRRRRCPGTVVADTASPRALGGLGGMEALVGTRHRQGGTASRPVAGVLDGTLTWR